MAVFKRCFFAFLFLQFLSISLFSQQVIKNYDKEWKNVETLISKKLPKSALAEVKKIYAQAKKDNQEAQVIKAALYMGSLQSETREENETLSINELEREISTSKPVPAAILRSMLATYYWQYYQSNRYKFYSRTATVNFNKADISTWGPEDFFSRIGELYLASLKDEKLLQQTSLQKYDALIIKGNVRHLRPTLYDLLAFRALEYFQNDERDIKKPAYTFTLDQSEAFDPAANFINARFTTPDTSSLYQKALLIYQHLLAFHLHDPKPDALIDADIHRLEFVHEKSVHPDKDVLYLGALDQLTKKYGMLPAAAQAWYLTANYYNDKADEYKPYGDSTHRFDRVKARDICKMIIQQKDSSEGKYNCLILLRNIEMPTLEFTMEYVNIPGQPFRALIKYSNINAVNLRIIQVDDKLRDLLKNMYDEKFWPFIINSQAVKNWQQKLPLPADYQEHAAEVKVDGLPVGEYLLVVSNDNKLSAADTRIGARHFYISGISYVNADKDFFVLDRESGQPLANASVQVWEQQYDYKASKYIRQKEKTYNTNGNGFFRLDKKPRPANQNYYSNNYWLDIYYKSDHLYLDEQLSDYYYYQEKKPTVTNNVFFFTDRSIYRPGQLVYFKGIVIRKESDNSKTAVNPGFSTHVILRDANYKDIDSISVTANEYGSFNGTFHLPAAGLNGQFSIYARSGDGSSGFRVEEYKRPKFYVEYEPLKGTYKVNDTIHLTGVAKGYAGNNIDGATVVYRVARKPRYIYSWMFWRWWQPPVKEMEIAHGEIKTGADGKFSIAFKAIPDLSIDKKFEPLFDYTVTADVTDVNGETRTGEKIVSVSYKALQLQVDIPARIPSDSLKKLSILTRNLNGEFQEATVSVTWRKLTPENRLIRGRYWERPDQFTMTKDEYIHLFPHDEYDNETDWKNWPKTAVAYDKTRKNDSTGIWSMNDGKPGVGFYEVEIIAKNEKGEQAKEIKFVELYDEASKKPAQPSYLWTGVESTTVEPGEIAKVEWGSSANDQFTVQQLVRSGNNDDDDPAVEYSFLSITNEKRVFQFPAKETDRGGYAVNWIFVRDNRFYQLDKTIMVPWTNKELQIEYETFRDKTLPGSEEKWKVRITGYKKEKLAAEMLGSMYDASLDQFYAHDWSIPNVWPAFYSNIRWDDKDNFQSVNSTERPEPNKIILTVNKVYDQLIIENNSDQVYYMYNVSPVARMKDGGQRDMKAPELYEAIGNLKTVDVHTAPLQSNKDGVDDKFDKEETPKQELTQIRKNFNETAFFFPELRTDSTGAIEFAFTIPEALTRWKFMALAHTKNGAFGSSTKEIVTQKDLMVQPNAPRFLREGDKMQFSAKVVNMTDKELTGSAELQLFDATTNERVDGSFQNMAANQYFTVAPGQSEAVLFPIEVPYLFNRALLYRVVAKSGNYSDGEENMLPVLTNRILVTESLPLNMRGDGTRTFSFDKLLNSGNSESLQHYALTVEYTSNPAWFAVQALPYLMEYPYECAEQTWNRYYANSLGTYIANSAPRIKQVFEKWRISDTAALMSNLQKNEELKSVLLEETPWVLQAKNESQQKRNIALLFDMIKMSDQLTSSYTKLKQMQSSNGGFVWFSGGPDDRYITQYIMSGIGHLQKLKAVAPGQDARLKDIVDAALPYLDRKIREDYDDLIKNKVNLKTYQPGSTQIQYLYMRSFYQNYPVAKEAVTAYNYFRGRIQQNWTTQSKYMQAMIALAFYRTADLKTPAAILRSLKETAINDEEQGMYYKDQRRGWFWYEAPIETQSLIIEAFAEVGKDSKTVDDLKLWLLKNKQTNNWRTTKATAEACYALLLQGSNWISQEPVVTINLGTTTLRSSDNKQEAGTGYFKSTIDGQFVKPDMGHIAVTVAAAQNNSSWGAVYWQYFEDMDKITNASTPLKLEKKLFIEKNTDRGPLLTPVNDGAELKVGDKIKVRIELRVDRDMEYVHMKDMRASAMEPVNVLSSYKWQGGLGYYESTKDASTNFFFSYLRKGTYVFEYPLFVTHAGNFSNGITTIQCMYAPEFSAHSEGVRIQVEDK